MDAILERLESGSVTAEQAADQLESAANAPAPFPPIVSLLAAAVACGGVAVIFGGNATETIIASLFGFVIGYLASISSRFVQRGLLEPLLGFSVAISAVVIGQWLPVNNRLITLFTLVVGVAIAWRLTGAWVEPGPRTIDPLPNWCLWIAVALTPIAFAIVTHARHSKAIGIAAFWQSTPSRSFPVKLPNSFRIKAGFVSTRRRDLLCFGNISATFSRTIGAFCRDCPINIGSTKSTFEQVVETVELGFLFGPDFLESSFGIVLGPTNCSGAYGWILHGASASEISSRKVSDLLTLCGMAGNVLDPSSMVPLGHQKQLVSFPGDLE